LSNVEFLPAGSLSPPLDRLVGYVDRLVLDYWVVVDLPIVLASENHENLLALIISYQAYSH